MPLLNQQGNLGNLQAPIQGGGNAIDVAVNSQPARQPFQAIDSVLTAISGQTYTGLPSSQTPSQLKGVAARNIAYWFVPEVGTVSMYINPQSINYNYKKLITSERTKGGYSVQYWGEELTTLSLRGHTGSSGVNGLNVLYEIYRAEQYLFDPIALMMAANSSIAGLNSAVDAALGNLGGLSGAISQGTAGVLTLDPASQTILPRHVPSLASMALGIELYWSGWVFRGYFNSFTVTESAERLGLFDYDIQFTVTQRRGYRVNYLPWQHSAIDGPSNWQTNPLSFNTLAGT